MFPPQNKISDAGSRKYPAMLLCIAVCRSTHRTIPAQNRIRKGTTVLSIAPLLSDWQYSTRQPGCQYKILHIKGTEVKQLLFTRRHREVFSRHAPFA